MERNKSQLQRLLFIDQQIRKGMRTGQLTNCAAMAASYEVSAKSIMRDITYLREQCAAPIDYAPSRHGFFYTEENYQLPAINISESDLFAICIADKALRQHQNTPIYSKLTRIFKKIQDALPERITINPDDSNDRMTVVNTPGTRIDPRLWEKVAKALRRKRQLRITYTKPGAKETTSRQVDPYQVISYQGEWYLIGYCHSRKAVRTFAISRINRATILPQTFILPKTFAGEAAIGPFGIFQGSGHYQVRIRFAAGNAPYIRERQWHPEQEIQDEENGGLLLAFPTEHLYEVLRWVLSFGAGAHVLAPPELVEMVGEELRKGTETYSATAPPSPQDPTITQIDRAVVTMTSKSRPLFLSAVTAGFPSPADDYIEKQLDVGDYLVKNPTATFFVRVAGDSMVDAGIHNDDILVVDRSLPPVSGRVVIAILNGELTVKKFEQRGEICRLLAANPDYPDIDISEDSELAIWGVVTHAIHHL
ncbi:MAG: translesion error-prone DNA polymerase V autoproteolytic subunit [Proteobacteria bacterium]|nr:translesion error-prone DNA polymerase V autoproteolytic subunit [Pseudomonadota bacterium]MBU1686399.1 translesion error-prone DNA polymerase V autoproteolytic subunit [Pseudomonadota bacterium]